jgi:hypothetical protein
VHCREITPSMVDTFSESVLAGGQDVGDYSLKLTPPQMLSLEPLDKLLKSCFKSLSMTLGTCQLVVNW